VPVGAADSAANWISRGSDIDFQHHVVRQGNCGFALMVKQGAARPALRVMGLMHNTRSRAKRKQWADPEGTPCRASGHRRRSGPLR